MAVKCVSHYVGKVNGISYYRMNGKVIYIGLVMADIIHFPGASVQSWNMVRESIKIQIQQHGVPKGVVKQVLTELRGVYSGLISKTMSVKYDIVDVEGLTEAQKKKLTKVFTQSTNLLEEQINQYSITLLALIAGLYVRSIMAERGLRSSLNIDA